MSERELEKSSRVQRSLHGVTQALQRTLRWSLDLPVGWRILMSALLGSLGGSTILGFFNLFTAYNYAYWYGARLPVEGLPYLSFTVSLLGLAFLLVVFVSTALISTVLWLVARALQGPSPRARLSVLVTFLVFVTWLSLFRPNSATDLWRIGLMLAAVALVSLALWRPGLAWVAGSSLALWLFLIVLGLMSQPKIYALLMRELRFGGGIRADIGETVDVLDQEPQYFLFLITADHFLLYEEGPRRFLEIPRTDRKALRYGAGETDYSLPPLRGPFRSTLTPDLLLKLLSLASFATLGTTIILGLRASRRVSIDSSAPQERES